MFFIDSHDMTLEGLKVTCLLKYIHGHETINFITYYLAVFVVFIKGKFDFKFAFCEISMDNNISQTVFALGLAESKPSLQIQILTP